MAAESGPDIVTDGLVLALDGANIRSFRGAPTTNVLPNAAVNGRFTTSNGWGTYNTNQYNSNQYFSIGTISSVSNNIVTTTSNHPLRTFDVVRPQTTGGGVTAGTNYFIKKISNTSFSIHQYNSSENGSQGYINASTGYHKVHDSIANDTRISVNSTNFPTMWWGPPHVPNSGLVKEIVEGGGYVRGTNCMRLHLPRTSGLDGLAYGVYTPVTQGDTITVSYWAKTNAVGEAGNAVMSYTTYFGGQSAFSQTTPTLTTDWKLITHQWVASTTYSFYQYWFPSTESAPYWIDIADLMVETGPASTTRFFTSGTRGATVATGGGWADLSGNNNHGELVNGPTYNSSNDGSIVFDGTNDYVTSPSSSSFAFGTGDFTLEVWIYPESFSAYTHMIALPSQNTFALKANISDGAIYFYSPSYSTYGSTSGWTLSLNTWNHVVFKRESSIGYAFLNGSSKGSKSGFTNNFSAQVLNIHNGWPSEYSQCKISIAKIYNRALSAAEVAQNYNATRNRFGI